MGTLSVSSNAFNEGGWMPLRYTARGENLSPDMEIEGIDSNAKTIAITMDDASHPIIPNFNHWVIWNIPVQTHIPKGILKGKHPDNLRSAIQGVAYGGNRYKGPKPPFKSIHTYVFTVYTLDTQIELDARSRKRDFLNKIEGHILQQATLSGKFQSRV